MPIYAARCSRRFFSGNILIGEGRLTLFLLINQHGIHVDEPLFTLSTRYAVN